MEIIEILDQSIWQNFFEASGSVSFLHSWEWGEFQKKQGYQMKRLGLYENNDIQAIVLVILIKSKRGKFLFIPHGPIVLKSSRPKLFYCINIIKQYLVKLAKKENCSFIRIASTFENSQTNEKIFTELGFRKAPIYMHSETMWRLPLNKTEDELLAQMRKTTRYLIKKAKKDGITIEKRLDKYAVDDFYELFKETVKRENFTPFSKKYITEEFNTFNKTSQALFLFGKTEQSNKTPVVPYLASALIIFTKSTAFYHQGASIHSKYPVPYLLQWEAICEAKKRGCRFYNFWGILKKGRTPRAWAGLTLFKQGFGGEEINYLPTQDLVLSPKYYLTYLYERYLNFRRGV